MYDELTAVDIKKMKEELEYRIGVVRPKILEEVKFTDSLVGATNHMFAQQMASKLNSMKEPITNYSRY